MSNPKSSKLQRIFPTKSSKILASALVIAVLLLSSFIALYHPSVVPNAVVSGSPFKSPQFLDAKLLPSSASLHVGGNQVFTLTIGNGSQPVSVQWSVNGSVIQSDYFTKSNSSFPIQSNYTYTCVDATLDTVNIQVQIIDALGRTTSESAVVYDPASYPANYLGASTATANYIIHADGTGWYYTVNGTDGSIVSGWTSTNSTQVANTAISSLTSGGKIVFNAGTYNLNGSISILNLNNIELSFMKGSLLYVANAMNNPAIVIIGSSGCTISGVTIDGNSANQVVSSPLGSDGIYVSTWATGYTALNCSDDLVIGANITNVRQYGFYSVGNLALGYQVSNMLVEDSSFSFCHWNGPTLADGSVGGGIINCHVAYGSDVGISINGHDNLVEGNYVHDMNGTSGFNNAHIGIAEETAAANCTIINNHIYNCVGVTAVGIDVYNIAGPCNTIAGNHIELIGNDGIELNTTNNNVYGNTIINWDTSAGYNYGIALDSGASYNLVYGNTLNSTYATSSGFWVVAGGTYNEFDDNYVYTCTTASSNCNGFTIDGNNNKVTGGTIIGCGGTAGIAIRTGASGTTVKDVSFTNIVNGNPSISDAGTYSLFSGNTPEINPVNLGNCSVIGTPVTVVVKQAVTVGQFLFRNSTGVFVASATSTATMLVEYLAIQNATINSNCQVIMLGVMRDDGWASGTVGATAYCSTAGVPTSTAPNTSGNVVQDSGKYDAAKILDFYNSGAWGTKV
jgi:hypothetical protein